LENFYLLTFHRETREKGGEKLKGQGNPKRVKLFLQSIF